ncbi:AAA family ATPase [Candidatus Dojkabacteria bacterium]|jgi:hypothetical protein|nr:AAA family ATPase [Candidatus Dojkabacteria bacterium]
MSHFKNYIGSEFLTAEFPKRDWLIENICRKNDSVILVGNEKSGKSLFVFQLLCSLTSCHPFLDLYNVPKPLKVVYIQLEGEIADSQDRMKRMIKTLDINPDNFHLRFSAPLNLEDKGFTDGLALDILKSLNPKGKVAGQELIKPDIVIIDPIYFAFTGSLNEDEDVRAFLGNLRTFKDTLNCAIILVHHTHKTRLNYKGNVIEEGDEALFGSKFLKAWADHILLFLFDQKTKLRTLSCNTQRSGDIIEACELRLIEPEPLYFEKVDKEPTKELVLVDLLKKEEFKEGLLVDEIKSKLGISNTSFYRSIKQPLAQDMIIKLGTKPQKYSYNWNRDKSAGLHMEKTAGKETE